MACCDFGRALGGGAACPEASLVKRLGEAAASLGGGPVAEGREIQFKGKRALP